MLASVNSLDQLRGYTVLGMFLVNFLGFFTVTPVLLKRQDTCCSYAVTIMPHIFFAVGFGYRLTFLRRVASENEAGVYRRCWRRNANLITLGAFICVVPEVVHSLTRAHPPSLTIF